MALVGRLYNILFILETQPDISQQELEQILGTSRQTLKKNIQLLNKELKDVAEITLDNHRYSLEVINIEEYDKILSGKLKKESDFNSSSKRIAYILKRLIEQANPIIIDDLSEELMVSRGTVTNDINALRKLVESYDIEIIGTPNKGLEISGEEINIRLIYINVVLEYFKLEQMGEARRERFLGVFKELLLPKQSIGLLLKVIETTVFRIQQKQNLTKRINYYDNFIKNNPVFEELISFVEIEYNITLSALEKDFICYPLNVFNQGNEPSKQYDFDIIQSIYELTISKIQGLFLLKFDKDRLYEDIKIHIAHMINRAIMKVETKDLFLNELEEKYPLSYTMGKIATQVISEIINKNIPDVEASYLTLYFEMAINRDEEESDKDIAVICHTGRGTAEIIKRQLQRVLGDNVTVTSYSQNEITSELLNKYVAVFTTIPLRIEGVEAPVIQLSMLFDESYVREQWEKIERTQNINQEYMEVVVTELDSTKIYSKNLKIMTDALLQKDLCDINFSQRILDREDVKSTVFDKGIAMPHAINKKGNKLVLNVGQFKDSYVTDNKSVELVFMIGIPETTSATIENILLDIYDFFFMAANNTNIKQELLNASNASDVKNIIREEVI